MSARFCRAVTLPGGVLECLWGRIFLYALTVFYRSLIGALTLMVKYVWKAVVIKNLWRQYDFDESVYGTTS